MSERQRRNLWSLLRRWLPRSRRGAKRFDHELVAAGGASVITYQGLRIIETRKIVGSVSRWQNLGSDFFYRYGVKVTDRFIRIGEAMKRGEPLPPIQVYKLQRLALRGKNGVSSSEYYVVDGHHRVAMAKKFRQEFIDADVVRFRVVERRQTGGSTPA